MVGPLVFRHGAAEVVFTVALVVWAAFEFVMRVRQHLLARGPAALDRSAFVLVPFIVASVVLAEVLGRRGGLPWPGGLVWPFVTGMVLIVAGIGLRAWSIATLGRFFQYWIKVQPGHRVVTGGPYRYVRHPSYTGEVSGIVVSGGMPEIAVERVRPPARCGIGRAVALGIDMAGRADSVANGTPAGQAAAGTDGGHVRCAGGPDGS